MLQYLSLCLITVFLNDLEFLPVQNHKWGISMSNLAFEIGFDHYLFKLPLDINRFSDEHRRQI